MQLGHRLFAVTSAGMVVVPILPDFSSEELDMIIEHSRGESVACFGPAVTKLSETDRCAPDSL